MKRLLFMVALLPLFTLAQKQGNLWYFGDGAGLDFSSGTPQIVTGGQTGTNLNGDNQEGTACISDSSGHLLFYSSAQQVFNRYHQVMPNGAGIMGGASSTQSCLIVPLPGNSNRFYLFTTDEFQSYIAGAGKGLRYSIVDMCADNGKGDVLPGSKNILLMDSTTEKLCAAQDAGGNGYWILGRKLFTPSFYAWHLTSAGIVNTVISNVDTTTFVNGWPMGQGQMKFSPDATKIALVYSNHQPASLAIFDFNPVTGVVSNQRQMLVDSAGLYKNSYGLEFSPDGTKVYVGSVGGAGPSKIYKYDVTAGGGTGVAINASKYAIYNGPYPATSGVLSGMQLGPDNKIYVVKDDYYTLACISSPNLAGPGAVFTDNAVTYSTYNGYTLPAFVAGYKYHNGLSFCSSASAQLGNCSDSCSGTAQATAINGLPAYSYHWSSTNDTTASVSNLCPGTYIVRVSDRAGDILFDTVSIVGTSTNAVSIMPGATVFCASDSAELCAPPGLSNYQWSNGATGACIFVKLAGNYHVTVTEGNCTVQSNNVAISVLPLPPVSISVNGDTLAAYGADGYQWTLNGTAINGATSGTHIANAPGDYAVIVIDSNGCSATSNAIVIWGMEGIAYDPEPFIYPNPAVDRLLVEIPGVSNSEINIYNSTGSLVMTVKTPAGHSSLPIDGLAAGIYVVEIKMKANVVRKRLVKI